MLHSGLACQELCLSTLSLPAITACAQCLSCVPADVTTLPKENPSAGVYAGKEQLGTLEGVWQKSQIIYCTVQLKGLAGEMLWLFQS